MASSPPLDLSTPRHAGPGGEPFGGLARLANRLPLVLGVTGHRHLPGEATDALKSAVQAYLRQLQAECPETPLLLLSPLAEGADQLVAAAALELRDDPAEPLDLELVATLPMPEALYLEDFGGEGGAAVRDEYRRLARRSCRTLHLPLVSDAARFDDEATAARARDLQYLLVGTYVARHCHILLALWDGDDARGTGGTGQVVRFKLTGRLDLPPEDRARVAGAPEAFGLPVHPLEEPETGPVLHFPVPAPGKRPPGPIVARYLTPGAREGDGAAGRDHEQAHYLHRFDQIHKGNLEEFNRLSRLLDRGGRPGGPKEARDAEAEERLPSGHLESLPGSLRALRDTFATADQLARQLKRRLNGMLSKVLVPILAAVVLFAVYAHLSDSESDYGLLAAYLVCLALADGIYLYGLKGEEAVRTFRSRRGPARLKIHGRDDQNRFQDYRTLCEGLRVQLYWSVVGLGSPASEYYLIRQKNELDWIRRAVRAWGLLAEPAAPGPGPGDDPARRGLAELARRLWVGHQLNYYLWTSYRERLTQLLIENTASGFLVVSLATSFAIAVHELRESVGGWGTALFVAPVLLVVLVHAVVKVGETNSESREDAEEFGRLEGVVMGREEIRRPDPLCPLLRHPLYRPLGVLLGGGRDAGKAIRRASWAGFLYGVAAGGLLTLLLSLAFLLLGIERLQGYLIPQMFKHEAHAWRDWAIVAMVMTVSLAALMQWYLEKHAFGSHYRQYKRMRELFLAAYQTLSAGREPGPWGSAETTFKQLGVEALSEHADWLLLHRERPLDLPKLEI